MINLKNCSGNNAFGENLKTEIVALIWRAGVESANMRIALTVAMVTVFAMQLNACYGAGNERPSSVDDFVEYWAAGRLTIDGANPYDPRKVKAVEQLVDPSLPVTIMMWNPPWSISLVLPLSLLDYRTARTIWALIQMAMLMGSAGWLWRYYGGKTSTAWLVGVASLLFPAALISLSIGQISPVVLFGLCALLYFEGKGRDMPAGFLAAMTLVKPHLVYLIWAAILLWSIHRKRWALLGGAILGTASLLVAPLLLDPGIIRQYFTAMREYPPDYYLTPTAGTLARLVLGWDQLWPQLLSNLIGAAWLVWYWWPRRHDWKWKDHLPVILVVSVLTAAFGWLFDQVVFLIPAIQLSTQVIRQWRTRAAKAAIMLLVFACVLSIVSWLLCIHLIQHPRNARLAGTAMAQALSERNQFWQIAILPVYLTAFHIGWKGVLHIFGDVKSPWFRGKY